MILFGLIFIEGVGRELFDLSSNIRYQSGES